MDKPQLLFLCQTLPYPPDGGVNIRTFNLLRILARAFDVTALCFFRRSARASAEAVRHGVAKLNEFADVEAFPIPQEHSRRRLLVDHVRSVLERRVYTVYAYDSEAYRNRLRTLLRNQRFDLVHVDSLDLSGYLADLPDIPVVCGHHNIESALLRRRAAFESSHIRRGYLRLQAKLMEREEQHWASRVDLNLTVSDADRRRLEDIAEGARVVTVPNGVDTSEFRPASDAEDGIVFVGGATWFPNRDALAYFAKDILPRIRDARLDANVTWIGRASEALRAEFRDTDGIELTGYVDDIRPYVQRAACYVVPLRVGGGTRLKILDAWAMGKALVTTSIGCEGLDARDGFNALVRDAPEQFADAVVRILSDAELRTHLGRNARRTAEEIYDWDVVGNSLLSAYATLAGVGVPRS